MVKFHSEAFALIWPRIGKGEGTKLDDLSSMMASDAGSARLAPTDEQLQLVADLAAKQLNLQAAVVEAEERLEKLKEDLAGVQELALPQALENIGMTMFKLTSGLIVGVKEDVYAGITKQNQVAAFQWLESVGDDGIIKNEVKLPFGKGQEEEAKAVISLLEEKGYSYTNSRSVHPQTLKAYVRRKMEEGTLIPTDIFSIHVKKVATIELPKEKKR